MKRRPWLFLSLLGLLISYSPLALPGLSGQGYRPPTPFDKSSHIPVGSPFSDPRTATEMLEQRLGDARGRSALHELAENVLQDRDKLQELADAAKKLDLSSDAVKNSLKQWQNEDLPTDPKVYKLLRDYVDKPGPDGQKLADQIGTKKVEDIKGFLDKHQPSTEGNQGSGIPGQEIQRPDKAQDGGGSDNPVLPPTPTLPPPSAVDKGERERETKNMLDFFGKGLKLPGGSLGQSSSSGRLIAQWMKSSPGKLGSNGSGKLSNPLRNVLEGAGSKMGLGGLKLPSLANMHLGSKPSSGGSSWQGSAGGGGAGGEGLGVLATMLLWIGLLAILGVVLWRLLGWKQAQAEGLGRAGWKLGPWPIHPSLVTTREQFIKAFEYLSVLGLGMAARHCNHKDIAARLGAQKTDNPEQRRQAADHLATVYEQARYAPPEEPLPAPALAAARRELCLLAGVAAS